ncbi:MAG: FtsX-like permease family protein, partial [Propionibacterium sp.]|nr:FtsX-like permease family protein [Propionibacterium sp.]
TAATTSALVIGVGLVVMMATGAATARATLSSTLDSSFPADVAVAATVGSGLTDEEIAAVEQVPGVIASAAAGEAMVTIRSAGAVAEFEHVFVADPVALGAAVNSRPFEVPGGHLAMDDQSFERLGAPAEVDLALDGDVQTVPVARVRDLPVTFLIAPADLELGDPPPAMMILADVDDDRADEVVGDLRQAMSDLSGEMAPYVEAPIEMRAMFDQIIDALLAVLIGLLAVAVVIALVGVANTLSLSVIERRREHGVLRAIGVTSPQVRQMLAVEAVLIAVAGAVIGILLGVLTGLAGSAILLGGTLDFTVGIDWWVMLGCAVIALVAGLVASVLPARTATRVPVVVALAAD